MKIAIVCANGKNDTRWTYISPAVDFQADGRHTGE